MTTRIGIIGIGGFAAHYHLPHLLARDNVSIAGICDTDATRLKKVDPRLTDVPSFTDYRPLLDLGLDALLISSPNIYHFEQCQAALEHDLHLLVDKPLTMTSDEAAVLIALARTRQRILMTAYTRHFMASAKTPTTVHRYTAASCTRAPYTSPISSPGLPENRSSA